MATLTTYDPETLFDKAHEAGMAALNAATPAPMVVTASFWGSDGGPKTYYEPEGMCGFASIAGIKGNSRMGKWLMQSGKGSKGYPSGVSVWVSHGGQSYDRKKAYAHAFATVLKESGVECRVEARLD